MLAGAASQRLPEGDAVFQVRLLEGDQRGLRRPQRSLGGQHRQIISDPGLIALQRDIQRFLLRRDVFILRVQLFAERFPPRQRVGDIFESALNRLLIGGDQPLFLRFSVAQLRQVAAAGKQRQADGRRE